MPWDREEDFEIEDAKCVGSTNMALLIRADDFRTDVWIPKSVISDDSEVYGDTYDEAGPGLLVVKGWYAEKQGWS